MSPILIKKIPKLQNISILVMDAEGLEAEGMRPGSAGRVGGQRMCNCLREWVCSWSLSPPPPLSKYYTHNQISTRRRAEVSPRITPGVSKPLPPPPPQGEDAMGRSCVLDSHPGRWMPAAVRMPACHSRR